MNYTFSKRSLQKLGECHEDLQAVMKVAIKNAPYDFGISWGHRSPVKQKELYEQGRTTPGNIVTYVDGYNKKSKHNYAPSLAVDVMAYIHGKITWEPHVYLELGTYIMEIAEDLFEGGYIKNRIVWGGHWNKFKDWPHFQI